MMFWYLDKSEFNIIVNVIESIKKLLSKLRLFFLKSIILNIIIHINNLILGFSNLSNVILCHSVKVYFPIESDHVRKRSL